MQIPKVFIFYSRDPNSHKERVLNLAIKLRRNAIEIILQQVQGASTK